MSKCLVMAFLGRAMATTLAGTLISISQFAVGAPVTSNAFATTKLIDFSQDEAVAGTTKTNVGVLVAEQVLWSSTDQSARANYKAGVILGNNGFWSGAINAQNGITFNSSPFATSGVGAIATMLFEFEAPVSGVGVFMNYGFPSNRTEPYPVKLVALDALGGALEDFDIIGDAPISTPGVAFQGAFRGFSRQTADIYGFALTGAVVLDNLVFSRDFAPAIVSAPGTLPLILAALGLAIAFHRRQGRTATASWL